MQNMGLVVAVQGKVFETCVDIKFFYLGSDLKLTLTLTLSLTLRLTVALGLGLG